MYRLQSLMMRLSIHSFIRFVDSEILHSFQFKFGSNEFSVIMRRAMPTVQYFKEQALHRPPTHYLLPPPPKLLLMLYMLHKVNPSMQ